jgi:hypothetical protein
VIAAPSEGDAVTSDIPNPHNTTHSPVIAGAPSHACRRLIMLDSVARRVRISL